MTIEMLGRVVAAEYEVQASAISRRAEKYVASLQVRRGQRTSVEQHSPNDSRPSSKECIAKCNTQCNPDSDDRFLDLDRNDLRQRSRRPRRRYQTRRAEINVESKQVEPQFRAYIRPLRTSATALSIPQAKVSMSQPQTITPGLQGSDSDSDIHVYVDGANDAERDRGAEAALKVFASWNVTPWDAALAFFRRGTQYLGETVDGRRSTMTTNEINWAEVFDDAERAALTACCAGWNEKPLRAYLLLSGRPPQTYVKNPEA